MKVLPKLIRTGSVFLAVVLLALFMSVPALASTSIDWNRLGSITINQSGSATGTNPPISGIKFTIYKVADLSSVGYTLTKDFSGSGLKLDQLSSASAVSAASKNLASYVSTNRIGGTSSVSDSSGTVKFSNLSLGYYLLVQSNTVSQTTRIICDPFLISVPMKSSDESSWIYDIVANTKCEAECGAVILKKINNAGALLSGAVFRLDKKVYYTDLIGLPSGVATGSDKNGTFYWSTSVSELTTNSNGEIAVQCMPFGQYRFVEVTAPSGYLLNTTPYEFSISATGSITLVNGQFIVASGSVQTITVTDYYSEPPHYGSQPYSFPSSEITVTSSSSEPSSSPETSVPPDENVSKPGFDLPKTGGSICYAVCTYGGIALMIVGAAVLVISRKKKE